jgi:Spy/CpxP family protein refolding chaperone
MNGLKAKMIVWGAAAVIALGGFTAMAHAQGPGGPHRGGFGPGGGLLHGRMAQALGLTDAQKEQIRSITKEAFAGNQTLRTQLKAAHDAEQAAIKAGKSDAELAQLAANSAPLQTQLHATRLQTEAKIYKVLTPDQQAKLNEMRAKMRERVGNAMQRWHRPAPAQQ